MSDDGAPCLASESSIDIEFVAGSPHPMQANKLTIADPGSRHHVDTPSDLGIRQGRPNLFAAGSTFPREMVDLTYCVGCF